MKSLKSIFISAFLILSTNANALVDPPAHCYAIEHGEDGYGSLKSTYLPQLWIGSSWQSYIEVTNISDKPVNVKTLFKNSDGSAFLPVAYANYDEFNSSNTPVDVALLWPGRSGTIRLDTQSTGNRVSGVIQWQADACINEALIVTVRSVYTVSGKYDGGVIFLNGGNPI